MLVRAGCVLASGPTREVLTGDAIAQLYGVRADVRFNDAAGHVTVVLLGRTPGGEERPR